MTIHHCVGALIVHQDTLLLGHRSSNRSFCPNVWDMFGGHIEPGEHPEQTLIRELQEELGIVPTQWVEFETLTDAIPERDEAVVCHVYLVLAWKGTPANQQPDEHTSIAWFTLDQAAQLDLAYPAYPQLFARALASATSG